MSAEREDLIPLSGATLPALRERGLCVPTYDRTRLRPRIAHIGVGGFHRAHLAVYCHELAGNGSDWGIRGLGLLPGDVAMAEALRAQDHLYTITLKSSGARDSEVVGSIVDFVLAVDDTGPAVAAIADPETSILSLTITEAGYGGSEASDHTFDVIASGLAARRAAGHRPITVMSCDNLPGNGAATRRCTLAAAERLDPSLATWVADGCAFPSSMVDRITPVTSDADRTHLVDEFGMVDRWPVVGEPFWQWALEDEFADGRPDFGSAGVLMTHEVDAWERYKLRFLNAGHSSIAYLCALAGITYVDEALADPTIHAFLAGLLHHEALPTVPEIAGHRREDYIDTVIERFANTGVRDQIARLCIDGTAKFPTFLIPTVAGALTSGGPVARSATALAGWAHYLADVPVAEQALDALGDATRARARAAVDAPRQFLLDNPVFPTDVATDERFGEAFERAHRIITAEGAMAAAAAATD